MFPIIHFFIIIKLLSKLKVKVKFKVIKFIFLTIILEIALNLLHLNYGLKNILNIQTVDLLIYLSVYFLMFICYFDTKRTNYGYYFYYVYFKNKIELLYRISIINLILI
jgi:hypothetical protein